MPVTVAVLLAVRALLRVLQAQLVAHLESLPHSPHNPHGLALGERADVGEGGRALGEDMGGWEQAVTGAGGQQLGQQRRETKPKAFGRAHMPHQPTPSAAGGTEPTPHPNSANTSASSKGEGVHPPGNPL